MGVSSVQPRHWGTVAEGWDGVGGRSYREVLDILVLRIDDLGELLAVNLLLEHPHAHLRRAQVSLPRTAPPAASTARLRGGSARGVAWRAPRRRTRRARGRCARRSCRSQTPSCRSPRSPPSPSSPARRAERACASQPLARVRGGGGAPRSGGCGRRERTSPPRSRRAGRCAPHASAHASSCKRFRSMSVANQDPISVGGTDAQPRHRAPRPGHRDDKT